MKWLIWRLKCLYVDIRQWIRLGSVDSSGWWAARHRYARGDMPLPGDAKILKGKKWWME